jgi:hypothetical protein
VVLLGNHYDKDGIIIPQAVWLTSFLLGLLTAGKPAFDYDKLDDSAVFPAAAVKGALQVF